jgi:putative transcriptional regulator
VANFLTNHFLIAMPAMEDPNFAQTVTLVCEHSERGALGIVINRTLPMTLGDVFGQLGLDSQRSRVNEQPVLRGGPVQTERGFVLHEKLGTGTTPYNSTLSIPGGLEMTTSKDVLEAMANGTGPQRVLITLGYSGWGAGQLEDEIGRNGWLTVDAQPEIIFEVPVEQRYERALALLGFDPRMLSQEAGHA